MKMIIEAFVFVLFMALMTIVMVEWAAGCGETYTDAQGVEHQNECVFLPNKGETK
jgi:hypothetical protein